MPAELLRQMPGDTVAGSPPPLVSPRIARLLSSADGHAIFSEDGGHFVGVREAWTPPPLAAEDREELQQQAAVLERGLQPIDRGVLLARVMALLAHYRQEAMPAEVERALAADWVDDLGEFPRWAVEQACRSWRRDPKRYRFRPLPGDLRQLCQSAVAQAREWQRRVHRLLALLEDPPARLPPASAGDLQRRIAAVAAARRWPMVGPRGPEAARKSHHTPPAGDARVPGGKAPLSNQPGSRIGIAAGGVSD